MIIYKSAAEIDLMREAGAILGEALAHLQSLARPGVTLIELDREADRVIRARDCIPGFVGYQGYRNAICTSVNDQVVCSASTPASSIAGSGPMPGSPSASARFHPRRSA